MGSGLDTIVCTLCVLDSTVPPHLSIQLYALSVYLIALYHLTSPAVCPRAHLLDVFVLPLGNVRLLPLRVRTIMTALNCTSLHALSAPLLVIAARFRIPNRRKKFQGHRAFSFTDPSSVGNNLHFSERHAPTSSSYKSQRNTRLFSVSYS